MENMIVIKNTPVLEERFEIIGSELEKRLAKIDNIVCTEDTYKDVKKLRAELNKESKEYAENFKSVKGELLEPWNKIEEAYKKQIKLRYSLADNLLKTRIQEIENNLKSKKEEEIKEHFKEINTVDFIEYEDLNITVRMSDSKKSLITQVDTFLEKVNNDLELIKVQNNKDEVLIEYKNHLDVSRAVKVVTERHKQLDAIKNVEQEPTVELEPTFEVEFETEEEVETSTIVITCTNSQKNDLKMYCAAKGIEVMEI